MIDLLHSKRTIVIGVINATPDSFSDGGDNYDPSQAVTAIADMLQHGAEIIDIGGESSRPDATPVSLEEELRRVIPVIKMARAQLGNDFLISIDTYKAQTAQEALNADANIINDITALTGDEKMIEVAKAFDCPVILMHMKGDPQTMQHGEIEYPDVVQEVKTYLSERIEFCLNNGIKKENIMVDPGIGFGKTVEHNLSLTKNISEIVSLGYPVVYGMSRKSTAGKVMQEYLNLASLPEPKDRLLASLAALGTAVMGGAQIVRVHDVAETKEFLSMIDSLQIT